MEKSERNLTIITVILVICVIVLGVYKLFFEKDKIVEEKIDTETISIVTNRNDFYTVSSTINSYISYLASNKSDVILEILDSKYKEENNITIDNLYNYVSKLSGMYLYQPKKMYEQRVSENIYKYYTFGYISQEFIGEMGPKQEYYLIVLLDEKNLTYSIMPYDGEMFKG